MAGWLPGPKGASAIVSTILTAGMVAGRRLERFFVLTVEAIEGTEAELMCV
jgi:hypothetical protein